MATGCWEFPFRSSCYFGYLVSFTKPSLLKPLVICGAALSNLCSFSIPWIEAKVAVVFPIQRFNCFNQGGRLHVTRNDPTNHLGHRITRRFQRDRWRSLLRDRLLRRWGARPRYSYFVDPCFAGKPVNRRKVSVLIQLRFGVAYLLVDEVEKAPASSGAFCFMAASNVRFGSLADIPPN